MQTNDVLISKRSQLLAFYQNWTDLARLQEISLHDFWDTYRVNFHTTDMDYDVVNPYESHYKFSLDGWEYHYYCCSWSVGWQGDVDSDEYCFKIKTITKAEMKEIEDLFNMQA